MFIKKVITKRLIRNIKQMFLEDEKRILTDKEAEEEAKKFLTALDCGLKLLNPYKKPN